MPLHRQPFWGWSLSEVLITLVVLAACIALVYVALKQFQIPVPGWASQVLWIVIITFVVVLAIRFVTSL